MGEKAQDNAYAERINGTIKNEYLRYWPIRTYEELRKSQRSCKSLQYPKDPQRTSHENDPSEV